MVLKRDLREEDSTEIIIGERLRSFGERKTMREEKRKIVSKVDGLELELLVVEPDEVHAVVQISHGMCEHKERYLEFMRFLAQHGIASIIHDHRGHGASVKSLNDLGYMYEQGAEGLVADLHQITLFARRCWEGVPLILLGHSMGSLAVRMYAKRYDRDIDALIVCGSPSKNSLLRLGIAIASVQKHIFGSRHRCKLLEALSFGPYAAKFRKEKSKFSWGCSDRDVVRRYEESILCGFTFTADGYLTLFGLMKETYSRDGWLCANPSLPILFLGGAEDPCIGGSRKFAHAIRCMRRAGYGRVKAKLYPGMRHEILLEREKESVYTDVLHFIERTRADGE